MIEKVEKPSHNLHRQQQMSIVFRNLTLLKVVAWLSSLGIVGSNAIAWADLKPISSLQTDARSIGHVSDLASNAPQNDSNREIFGLPLPTNQKPLVSPISADSLPNREVPIAVELSSTSMLPTGKIARPQHADLLAAENYSVSVNIAVPTQLSKKIPQRNAEKVTATSSRVQPSVAIVRQSIPATSLKSPARQQAQFSDRPVPSVSSLPKIVRPTSENSSVRRNVINSPVLSSNVVAPLRPTVIKTTSPSTAIKSVVSTIQPVTVKPSTSIEIGVPVAQIQTIPVKAVIQLPQMSRGQVVPTVPALPTVHPAGTNQNNGSEFSSELIYPLTAPAPTTSGFGWRTHPITGGRRFHAGIDLGAPMGAPVVAVGTGTIISAGWIGGYGKAIVIQHGDLHQTLYGHLSEIMVRPGQTIEQGTVIGRVGSTGNSTGPHLHYETLMATPDGWVAVDPTNDVKYALDNLRRSMPFAQRDLRPAIDRSIRIE